MTDLENKQRTDEDARILTQFRVAFAVSLSVLAIGAVFYHYVEHLSWLNSVYFCVITLATIGYGDITPKTDLGKLFTIFYVLAGVGIIASLANLMVKRAAIKHRPK